MTAPPGSLILIGQYDSPFVRRVGIALRLYGLPFEHRPWSVFGDAARIRPVNPLVRVPTLILGDGTSLWDSHMILDYLDGLVPDDRVMVPRREPGRHRALRIAALATGLADKAVSLFYERRLHEVSSPAWSERCRWQAGGAIARLEAERAAAPGPWWSGERIGHADIAVACCLRFADEAHPGLVDWPSLPALRDHCARAEALEAFVAIRQPFVAPV